MAGYTTIDSIQDIIKEEIASAINMPFSDSEDNSYVYIEINEFGQAPFNPVYEISATQGLSYTFLDISFHDPYLRIYDSLGNAISTNSESEDTESETYFYDQLHIQGELEYSLDIIKSWIPPYTGTFYVKPGWDQDSYYQLYQLTIMGKILPPPPYVDDRDRVFNWGESTYSNLFPSHTESQEVFGYYARIYSNGDALGEKDGNIYYYDGGSDGNGQIILVGEISDFLPQAVAAGF